MKVSLTSFKRPWDWGNYWVTRYRSRPGNVFFQFWFGHRGWAFLIENPERGDGK